jgi:hypothetical protein
MEVMLVASSVAIVETSPQLVLYLRGSRFLDIFAWMAEDKGT